MSEEITKHVTSINGLQLRLNILYDSLIQHLLSSSIQPLENGIRQK